MDMCVYVRRVGRRRRRNHVRVRKREKGREIGESKMKVHFFLGSKVRVGEEVEDPRRALPLRPVAILLSRT